MSLKKLNQQFEMASYQRQIITESVIKLQIPRCTFQSTTKLSRVRSSSFSGAKSIALSQPKICFSVNSIQGSPFAINQQTLQARLSYQENRFGNASCKYIPTIPVSCIEQSIYCKTDTILVVLSLFYSRDNSGQQKVK